MTSMRLEVLPNGLRAIKGDKSFVLTDADTMRIHDEICQRESELFPDTGRFWSMETKLKMSLRKVEKMLDDL